MSDISKYVRTANGSFTSEIGLFIERNDKMIENLTKGKKSIFMTIGNAVGEEATIMKSALKSGKAGRVKGLSGNMPKNFRERSSVTRYEEKYVSLAHKKINGLKEETQEEIKKRLRETVEKRTKEKVEKLSQFETLIAGFSTPLVRIAKTTTDAVAINFLNSAESRNERKENLMALLSEGAKPHRIGKIKHPGFLPYSYTGKGSLTVAPRGQGLMIVALERSKNRINNILSSRKPYRDMRELDGSSGKEK